MAKLIFKTHARVPDTATYHYMLVLFSETVAEITRSKDAAEAERLAEMAAQEATRLVATVPMEHAGKNKGANWPKYARLRIKFERANFKLLRDFVFPHTARPGLLTMMQAVDLVVRDMDRAYDAAPPLDDEKQRAVPDIELPDPPSVPANVDYGSLLDESKSDDE